MSQKKLFKVASEYNVSTASIVDTLESHGYEIANKPNSTITAEMQEVLEKAYGVGADTNGGGTASGVADVSLEPTLEPSLEPTIEPSLEPTLEPSLEPTTESSLGSATELSLDESETSSDEPTKETDSDTTNEAQTQKADSTNAELIEDVSAEEGIIEPSKEQKEEHQDVGKDDVDDDASVDEAIEQTESESRDSEHEEHAQSGKDDRRSESTNITDQPDEEDKAPNQDDDDPEITIRAKSDKLSGTKVLGRVTFSEEKRTGVSTGKPAATRKRKKDRVAGEAAPVADGAADKGKKKGKGRKSKVGAEEVDKSMKKTLQELKRGGSVGTKRQKRRRQRRDERAEEAELKQMEQDLEAGVLEVSEFVTVSDLAELLEVSANEIIMACMNIGMMVSINQRLDAATIELLAEEFNQEVKFITADEMLEDDIEEIVDAPEDLKPRAPIITVMGHVDHGKTSLLDYIRSAKVAAGEAGGITQHVGAYEVKTDDGRVITFLDTPGHEAFTAMRSRGAQITDIVILVVAADDSVMPQTIEAINHAKAAGVSIVVAINKVDKDGASPDKIKQQLTEHGVIVEEYGGTNQSALVSAKTGQGIDDLLDKVLIEAELKDLKANPDRRATGIILEARVDKGKGIIANVLVEKGTLAVGDPFVAGPTAGRVRAMENEFGERLVNAGPSSPLQLTGFDEIPQAGDILQGMKDEKSARDLANRRQQIKREQALRKTKHLTLDDLARRMALGEVKDLNIIIKADVDGSIEALSGSLQKLSTDEVTVQIIHTGSGAITESDVLLASASDAIIIGFQVRPTSSARKLAETESIDIRLFSVIYDAIDEVRDALEGLLSPEIKEEIKGTVDVREVFKISKIGTIAGCYVTDGKIERNNPVRIIRDGIVVYTGQIDSLKRFKDDVKDVASGYECGISIVNFNDLKVGDQIESYAITEEKRTLEQASR